MVAAKQISVAALLWLGLANQGLALGIDEATNDLTLMERSPAPKGPMAKFIAAGRPAGGPIHRLRDEEEELDARDEEELDQRDPDIETRRERPGHAPSHSPRKHGRDLEESDLETRLPRRAIPGGTRGSWGGQNGPRPRDIEARGPPVPGGGGRPRPIRSPRPSGRSLDVRMGGFGVTRGPRRPRPRSLQDE